MTTKEILQLDRIEDMMFENGENVDKLAIKQIIGDKLATMKQIESKIGDNNALPPRNGDKLPIRDGME